MMLARFMNFVIMPQFDVTNPSKLAASISSNFASRATHCSSLLFLFMLFFLPVTLLLRTQSSLSFVCIVTLQSSLLQVCRMRHVMFPDNLAEEIR